MKNLNQNNINNVAVKENGIKNLGYRFMVWGFHKKQEIKEILSNNKGMGIVELALIIVIIIALAYVFKDKISGLLTEIFTKMKIENLETRPS